MLIIATALILRTAFLSRMEFKSDERTSATIIRSLKMMPFTFTAPEVSEHSGIRHPSGFYYFTRILAPDPARPLDIALAIALFNTLAIALAALAHLPLFALMCATSTALVLGSRKIWPPDLVAPWMIISITLIETALRAETGGKTRLRLSRAAAAAAGLSLWLGAHMYLAGALVAMIGTIAFFIALRLRRSRAVPAFAFGAVAGAASLLPYAFAVRQDIAMLAARINPSLLGRALGSAISSASPLDFYMLYLMPESWKILNAGGVAAVLAYLATSAAIVLWCALMGGAFFSAIRPGPPAYREILSSPSALAALALLAVFPCALSVAGLGNHLHYWFGVMPFSYYLVSWIQPRAGATLKRLFTFLIAAGCIFSFIATSCVLVLVYQLDGLPGEYGPAKQRTQVQNALQTVPRFKDCKSMSARCRPRKRCLHTTRDKAACESHANADPRLFFFPSLFCRTPCHRLRS